MGGESDILPPHTLPAPVIGENDEFSIQGYLKCDRVLARPSRCKGSQKASWKKRRNAGQLSVSGGLLPVPYGLIKDACQEATNQALA